MSDTTVIEWPTSTILIPICWENADKTVDRDPSYYIMVEAEVSGPFAIHGDVQVDGWGRAAWTVTHVPTGCCLASSWTKRRAREFCTAVAPIADWATIRPGDVPADIKTTLIAAMRTARSPYDDDLDYEEAAATPILVAAPSPAAPGADGGGQR